MIKGMDIILHQKEKTGTDEFGAPIYTYTPVVVKDVLVAPASAEDIINSQELYGKRVTYNLGIPKDDTHVWEDVTVEFMGRKWKSFGAPLEGIPENMPLRWNKKVMVEWYD